MVLNTKHWNDHTKYATKLKKEFETGKRWLIGLCPYCCCNTAHLTIYCWQIVAVGSSLARWTWYPTVIRGTCPPLMDQSVSMIHGCNSLVLMVSNQNVWSSLLAYIPITSHFWCIINVVFLWNPFFGWTKIPQLKAKVQTVTSKHRFWLVKSPFWYHHFCLWNSHVWWLKQDVSCFKSHVFPYFSCLKTQFLIVQTWWLIG